MKSCSMLRYGAWMFLLVLFGSVLNSGCTKGTSEYLDTTAVSIKPTVRTLKIVTPYYLQKVAHKTGRFYEGNGNKKAWLGKKAPNKNYKAFVNEVLESYKYGMNPEDYNISRIEKDIETLYNNRERTEADISKLDIEITASFFLFTTHLLEGRIRRPGAGDFIWTKGAPDEDDVALLLNAESSADLRKEIDRLHPDDPQYEKLRKALADYKTLSEQDDRFSVKISKAIKPGSIHEAIPAIRKRLALTDFKGDQPDDSLTYDGKLEEAVKKFQKRHGLKETGIVDGETISALKASFKHKAELIALNLERLRWHPHLTYDNDEINVNVPEYMLRIYKNGKETMEMRVILGEEFNATPIFNDTMKFVVFSPTWNVPKSILEEEFLPNLQNNPDHYSTDFVFYKDGEEIDPAEEDWEDEKLDISKYKAVQNPGDMNALGHVKFVMPNNYNIYLHDTPHDGLFRREERALSHGCVRLERPVDLAEYLLNDQDFDKKKIEQMMLEEEPKTVNLKRNYPVNIIYRTVFVDDDGLVHFRKDIYGHDERQLAQLRRSGDFQGVISSTSADKTGD